MKDNLMRFYIKEMTTKENHAGTKARDDADAIAEKVGFQPLIITPDSIASQQQIKNKLENLKNFNRNKKVIKAACETPCMIFLQYPTYLNQKTYDWMFDQYADDCIFVALIHDLDMLRNFSNQQKEIDQLRCCSYVIAHNEAMCKYLRPLLQDTNVISLEIFDYLLDDKVEITTSNKQKDGGVVVSGNLHPQKAGYLYDQSEIFANQHFNLFGPNFDEQLLPTQNYKGQFTPDEIVTHMYGSFGLVWDGEAITTCQGSFGEYLKLNNPHKVSLYLVSGFPVIIWEQAALASFITENHLGFTIQCIDEIEEKIAALSKQEYEIMLTHVMQISNRLRHGYYLETALHKTMEY